MTQATCHPEAKHHAHGLCRKCYRRENRIDINWQARLRPSTRRYYLKRNYNITPEQYDALEEWQGGVCAVCRESDPNRRLDVDHNHETGEIRGLLCRRCNMAVGYLRDRIDLAREVVTYLERYM